MTDGSVPFKRKLYDLLEDTGRNRIAARTLRQFLLGLIVANVAFAIFETVPAIQAADGGLLSKLQLVSGVIFLLEYVCRLYVADLHPPLRRYSPLKARIRYALQPDAIVDLIAALPLILIFILPNNAVTVVVIFRLLRFLKLARYSPALRSLLSAIASERHALMGCAVIVSGVILMSATLMYLVEADDQPDKLGSIPHAIYWAVTTITTVGYGDVVPVTETGRVIAAFVMLLGYALIALPVGIIASAFAREIHSRDFVVTWSMVARVPLFEALSAAEIAEVSKLLEAQKVRAGTVIAAAGDVADRMYFISEGQAEIRLQDQTIYLDEGDYFGEFALIHQQQRSVSVRAHSDCELLVLAAHSLQELMDRNPKLTHKILKEAEERTEAKLRGFGDLAVEELEQADIVYEENTAPEPDLFRPGQKDS
ncbi:cyclic nucleotide-binding protein [Roseibium aquae]|uniref:Cyclic nucleotide-binding protein n=1 Tax=Roseibium aquae TaxID=1323746 RepID=A0A916TAY2_9HYPH|nr:cyclic nucleotide-gated ion channel [Roseibium aquae]GGB37581.1 cyclic nucleotide-binding protein [Roseibium aquae]